MHKLLTAGLNPLEITEHAYQFAHQYDREYGDSGAVPNGVLRPGQLNRILVDKALNVIPNCSVDDANQIAMVTEKILETMGLDVKVACDANEEEEMIAQQQLQSLIKKKYVQADAVMEELNKPVNALDPQ